MNGDVNNSAPPRSDAPVSLVSNEMAPADQASEDAISRAEDVQRLASDPRASVFVSASAGSGKTKLLIDRLLRLMLPIAGQDPRSEAPIILPGVAPARILSLTYTKAAAAEMSTRLQSQLGSWVMMDDDGLNKALTGLEVPCTAHCRDAARALFAQVLDCPGGMRIGTIHAFCQSLLRRFPLEAAVAPQFKLLEDADVSAALHLALEEEIVRCGSGADRAALEDLSRKRDYDTIKEFAARLYAGRGSQRGFQVLQTLGSAALRKRYQDLLGLEGCDAEVIQKALVTPRDEDALRRVIVEGLEIATPSQTTRYLAMAAWLDTHVDDRDPSTWRRLLLTESGTLRAMSAFVPKKQADQHPHLYTVIVREAEHLIEAHLKSTLLEVYASNITSVSLVMAALVRLDQHKASQGLVDYEDLIAATRVLLHDPGAAWVLYCLDGGIDHLLLDEVQDTSPAQWEIARALSDDFFSGASAHKQDETRPRTIFAVGDFKQSIFSFQGAEPHAFIAARHDFGRKVQQAGQCWRTPSLDVSFRSVRPVLAFVDAVFSQGEAAEGLLDQAPGEGQGVPAHRASRVTDQGRVELWPRLPRDKPSEDQDPWGLADPLQTTDDIPNRMAETIAQWLHARLGRPPFEGQEPLAPGDVLILVRRRTPFLWALVRALKARNIEVSTFVRTNLLDQLAVQDLIALCEVLLLPQDDLMLANVLTSPFGDLSDPALMALAAERGKKPLWTVLQDRHTERDDWTAAWNMLSGLQSRLDYAPPYDILSDALGRYGGRARCLRRLGAEARDAIDDMLGVALQYESGHAPSMQGFLSWLRESEGTIKRDTEAESTSVRIMTVHASKGLQARLVILPDTAPHAPPVSPHINVCDAGVDLPLLSMSGIKAAPKVAATATENTKKVREESHRLLYVALTRARDWLVVCGWESGRTVKEGTDWYDLCASGFKQLATHDVPFDGGWEGRTLLHETPKLEARGSNDASTAGALLRKDLIQHDSCAEEVGRLPSVFGRAPEWTPVTLSPEPRQARPLAPSRPEGAIFGLLPAARSPLEPFSETRRQMALRRGVVVHRLLQFLPDIPVALRRASAQAWLQQPAFNFDLAYIDKLIEDVISVIAHPQLAPLYGPGSRAEQAITGVHEGQVVVGQVDRYAFIDGCLYVCDYKTNQNPPETRAMVPETYRKQMATYVAILKKIHAAERVVAALVWTEGARITFLGEEMRISAET